MLNKVAPKHKAPITVAFIICTLAVLSSLSLTSIYALSPYDSGYDHGCNDAGISDSSEHYINQPNKGPSHHTSEFMDGYYAGVNACSSSYETSTPQYTEPQSTTSNPQPNCNGASLLGGLVGGAIGSFAGPLGTLGGAASGADLAGNLCNN